jgi:hypothetical protein
VIVASNVNTDIFRQKGKKYSPAEDLDYWVNLRVHLESDEKAIGVAQMAPSEAQARAVLIPMSKLLALRGETQKQDSFAVKGKQRFVIAVPDTNANPTFEELDFLLNTLGVNIVPLHIFGGESAGVLKGLMKLYKNTSYSVKPSTLQKIGK